MSYNRYFFFSFSLSDKDIDGCLDSRVIQKLKNLNVLDISQNNITEIPELLQLPNLETLDCSYNDLQSIQFLNNFKNCKQLYIDGNDSIEVSYRSYSNTAVLMTSTGPPAQDQ